MVNAENWSGMINMKVIPCSVSGTLFAMAHLDYTCGRITPKGKRTAQLDRASIYYILEL